ncbi:amphi-Trp domain-containing protein [Halomarina oriensis]|uniref:Amphi-Trp domain-containing protein n=1 Tax=Halomarina oriensis TaxID=671145 RepID=A0A6B0GPF1_9EURY|nr:amphi-Trp domain-containing protein [Halomarina oriensis]MWG36746.1 amphi-Trp domain-containing protein [Halomarina oriensis]
MEEVLFESETRLDRATIAEHLRAVADKLEAGDPVVLSAGSESVTMDVPARPTFEVKAERETGSGAPELSVEFELEWDEGQDDDGGTDGSFSVE